MSYIATDNREKSGPGIERVGHILNSLQPKSYTSTHSIYSRVGRNITDRKTLEKDLKYCNDSGLVIGKEKPYGKGRAIYYSITELGMQLRDKINEIFLRRKKYTCIIVSSNY